jgi:putative ABC transport system permease protein
LGASVTSIITLLSKEFIQLVGIAFFIATPIAWYFSNQWLQNFANHIEMKWWIFGLTIGIAIMITLITVGLQGLRVATRNPVETLRNE